MTGIAKSFGGGRCAGARDFSVRKGEIHALLGGNGAGKSTVLKMLSGVHKPDKGRFGLTGSSSKNIHLKRRSLGIAMIFQEMSLIPSLSVAQNIFLTREPKPAWACSTTARLEERACLLEKIGVGLDPRRRVDSLSSGQRQLTESRKPFLSRRAFYHGRANVTLARRNRPSVCSSTAEAVPRVDHLRFAQNGRNRASRIVSPLFRTGAT